MKIKEIISVLEDFAPAELAEEWDNVGLMIGDTEEKCGGIMTALDLTYDVAAQAEKEGCNLIITHHPFIFHPLNRIDFNDSKGRIIKKLIECGINVYSMHTNLDKAAGGVNCCLANVLGASSFEQDGLGVVFDIKAATLYDFAKSVSEKLGDKSIKIVGKPNKIISRAYVVGGSGGSEYCRAKQCADVLLTGDLKHHNYIDAIEDDFALIEFSHYASEIIICDILKNALKDIGVRIIKAKQDSPFRLLEEI